MSEIVENNSELPESRKKWRRILRWFTQPATWAVMISLTALALSQLPPIKTWIPKDNIKAEVSRRIGLPNKIGVTGYQFLLDLKNIGNRSLTISGLELNAIYPNGNVTRSKAESYIRNSSGYSNLPVTSIKLNVGEQWSESVLFFPLLSPSEEEETNRIEVAISESILSKIQAQPSNQYNPNYPIAADPKVAAEAISLFNRRFELDKGTYRVSVTCDMNGQKITLKQFEFTLYDDQIKRFKLQAESYKFGWGILGPLEQGKEVWVTMSETDQNLQVVQ